VSSAGLVRRAFSALYDLLLVAALLLVATFPFLAAVGDSTSGLQRNLLQFYVLVVTGAYFISCWALGGQTLAMKTWRIRLVMADGGRPGVPVALKRYLLALLSLSLAGAGFLWALVDRDRQFLHDRLCGTRLVGVTGATP
jgi:uncharacterized RDD family membrane protein YckC